MSAVLEYMHLCRLCLVKDKVDIPIFGETSDVQSVFLKISACLPVKVSQDDNLPQKICDACVYKLDSLYQFWNTAVDAEKQLLQWLGTDANAKGPGDTPGGALLLPQSHAHPHSIPTETIMLKEERPDPDSYALSTHVSLYSEEYEMPYAQQQIADTVTTISVTTKTAAAKASTTNEQTQGRKRRKRMQPVGRPKVNRVAGIGLGQVSTSAALDNEAESSEERLVGDSDDEARTETFKTTKAEAESDDDDYVDDAASLEPTTFVGVPSTSVCDSELAGPSGISKSSTALTPATVASPTVSSNQGPALQPVYTHTEDPLAPPAVHACPVCRKTFTKRANLVRHSGRHGRAPAHACNLCPKRFYTGSDLSRHKEYHGAERKHQCHQCGKRFKTASNLGIHTRRHNKAYVIECADCAKGFYSQTQYRTHYAVCHQGKRVPCVHCGKTFACQANYRDHLKLHEPEARLALPCPKCDKVYGNRNAWRVHVRRHERTVFVCDVCGKSVTSASSLRNHARVHTGAKPFVCHACGKTFGTAALLKVHARTHTQERPFQCTDCGKSFTQQSTLIVHRRYHSGERPHACPICHKRFVTKTLMRNHTRSHGIALADM